MVRPVVLLSLAFALCASIHGRAASTRTPAQRAERVFIAAREQWTTNKLDSSPGWQFARAAFDWAEFSKTDKQRAAIAEEGIAAGRKAVELAPECAAAYYYLGMNLGQLARTKSVGALKLVDEMEVLFIKARELDEYLDYAGPDRNLGLLYLEAPIFSVGDKKKARVHLLRALELRPEYPENHMNMVEAYLKWGEKSAAQKQLTLLAEIWDPAREALVGEQFATAWSDWQRRLDRARAKVRGDKRF